MSDYSIFALGESQLTISDGAQLDGVDQGNGSHLVGTTITLNSDAWEEMQIIDNDVNFQDSDGSQELNGAQTFDGVAYADGTVIEAEYSLVLTDGTDSWTAIGFNLNTSSPAYGTVEGLAFIGGPGGFPPVGVDLVVVSAGEGPSFAAAAYATPVCFARGTMIDTITGPRAIETLTPGDLIQTADDCVLPLRWVGGRHVLGVGRFAPVRIEAGCFGATAPLTVSQQHRLMMQNTAAELLFGDAEVFVAAAHLTNGTSVRVLDRVPVEYFHLVLDRHAVIFANGVATESLYCSDTDSEGTFASARQFYPELDQLGVHHISTARPCLRRHESELLVAQAGGVERLAGLGHSAANRDDAIPAQAGSTKGMHYGSGSGLRNWVFGRFDRRAG